MVAAAMPDITPEERAALRRGLRHAVEAVAAVGRGAPIDFTGAQMADMAPEFRDDRGASPIERRVGLALCRFCYFRLFRGTDPEDAKVIADSMFDRKPGLYILQARAVLAAIREFDATEAETR